MSKFLKIVLAASLLAFMAPASALQVCSHGMVDHGSADMLTHDNGLTRSDFALLPTSWDPGANTARINAGIIPAPGGATWSIMGAGFVDVSTFDPDHTGATQDITALGVAGWGATEYANMINAALNVWASVSGFTNLGQVADGAVDAGAAEPAGGLGDIRIAAWEISTSNVLAHAFQPGNESIFGPGGSIAGDLHMDVNRNWTDAAGGFDIFTVMLHELGHALGLGHSNVVGSVMEAVYGGVRRILIADDIAGIQAIYGPQERVDLPEPGTLWLLGMGLLALGLTRRLS